MKRSSPTLFLVAAAALSLCVSAGAANIIQPEQFVNYPTAQLGTGDGSWANGQVQIWVTNGIGSLSGTSLGLVASAGDMVSVFAPSNTALGCYNVFCAKSTFPQTTPTNLYYSFLYRFNVGTDVPAAGIKIAQVNRQNSGFATGVHWDVIAKNVAGQIQLGIFKAGGTATYYATNLISAGDIVFVVVRQQIMTGATDDIDDLWVDPPTASFGADESSVPPVSATTTDGTEDSSSSGPGRFWIGAAGQNANFDELRIAGTWAGVTPAAGQCVAAGVTLDPVSVKQSAEINANFKIIAAGTSPTYQWQLSQNGGSLWTDIPGAIFASYTTPNLQLATDNGNQYRAVVHVACNNSSATSGVATVTLTAPVVTHIGTVMDDLFDHQIRNNPPVGPDNSLWYTAAAASSDLYLNPSPPPGYMLATPITGSSTLWWGNFVDESTTNLPVDLAVGTGIRVTMPFTIGGFTSFTNNASFRAGLFDYAYGGALLTSDSTLATGSGGNGTNVRGYMLAIDWGQKFSANSPLTIYARNGLGDINLMGTTGDFVSLGSGPSGGGFSNSPAFQASTPYTLVFTVARTGVNSSTVGASITGGGTNYTFSATDTNDYGYHRFDVFAMRPNSLETSADSFTFNEFKVEVYQASIQAPPFNISAFNMPSPSSFVLTWASASGVTYAVESTAALGTSWTTNALVPATAATSSYTNTPLSGAQRFYRIVALGQ